MRICDKCKTKLEKGDLNVHIDLGAGFIYDLCHDCHIDFLTHVDDFFYKKDEKLKE